MIGPIVRLSETIWAFVLAGEFILDDGAFARLPLAHHTHGRGQNK